MVVRAALLVSAFLLAGCVQDTAGLAPREHWEALLWTGVPKVIVRIDHAEGRAPDAAAIEALRDALKEVAQKQEVMVDGPHTLPSPASASRTYSRVALDVFHSEAFGPIAHEPLQNGSAFIHVIYLAGSYESGAVGLYTGPEIYIFPDAIGRERPLPGIERIERAVLVHELGHAFGLVDCGVPEVRPHGDGDCHSSNTRSVMYSSVDTGGISSSLDVIEEGTWLPYEFDADDLADIRAFQARGPR